MRVKTIIANDDEDGIGVLLNEPGCALGLSDAGAHVGQLCDAPLPTDLLGPWVRDRGVMSLEKAVHKLTQEPAELFGFDGRGVLQRRRVRRPRRVRPRHRRPRSAAPRARLPGQQRATHRRRADRYASRLVNGVATRVDEQVLDAWPGRVVSPQPR